MPACENWRTGTPTRSSARAKSAPSSRKGSYSAVWISARGAPAKSARSGATRIVRREAVDAIEFPIPRHRRFLDEIAAGQFASRSGAAERVQDRTEQQLQREL